MDAVTDAEEMRTQLEICKTDLKQAEIQRAEALLYKTEVDGLKTRLSEKEEKLQDLSNELDQRERELARLKDKEKEGSAHGESKAKICSKSNFLVHGPVLFEESRCCGHKVAEWSAKRSSSFSKQKPSARRLLIGASPTS